MQSWLSILMLVAVGVGFGAFTVFISQLLGPKKVTPEKLAPYECGVPPVGDARERMSVQFYLVAMVFLLFDIEVAFLYPWALAARDLGWTGYVQIVLFMAILACGYVYIWRKGVLDWGPATGRRRVAPATRGWADGSRTAA
ncbi:MAG TPA: NADH-quinone oxidoreductase subunit A [Gemmatimonadaceae bacterium]|nr:NADH-quinone oxidoreductase subunit A [Gemmatimonadaceae bacterium]